MRQPTDQAADCYIAERMEFWRSRDLALNIVDLCYQDVHVMFAPDGKRVRVETGSGQVLTGPIDWQVNGGRMK